MAGEYKSLAVVLDAGTTQVKAIAFNEREEVVGRAGVDLLMARPRKGWAEQDPMEIREAARLALMGIAKQLGKEKDKIAAIGVTGQRETVVAWDKETGKPIYPAISWEDERGKELCTRLSQDAGQDIRQLTGLDAETYFSAPKMQWVMKEVEEAENLAAAGKLAMGTVDSWLVWHLQKDKQLLTDYTNASRTLLFNIREKKWEEKLIRNFEVPRTVLPQVLPSGGFYGNTETAWLGKSVPLLAVCGDGQASLFAAGSGRGTTKITYGTGTFVMQVVGDEFVLREGFYTTLTARGSYALEAKVAQSGKEAEKHLGDVKKLREFLRKLAEAVDEYIKKLPETPKEIIIDGGVMRDGILRELQEEVSGIPVKEQVIFDGTALGVARLVFSELN